MGDKSSGKYNESNTKDDGVETGDYATKSRRNNNTKNTVNDCMEIKTEDDVMTESASTALKKEVEAIGEDDATSVSSRVSNISGLKAEDETTYGCSLAKIKDEYVDVIEYGHFTRIKTEGDATAGESNSNTYSITFIKAEPDDSSGELGDSNGDEVAPLTQRSKDKEVADNWREDLISKSANIPRHFASDRIPSKKNAYNYSNYKYNCSTCTYGCNYKSSLINHMRIHTGEKPFPCVYCDYRCTQAGQLKVHMRNHTGDKPFSCDQCDYRCSRAGCMTRHMKIHTGEKAFSCGYCHYSCRQAGDLKVHMRSHTGEKPFSCKHCDYRCSRAGNMERHIRIHKREKPFSCDFCDYRSNRAGNLKEHVRAHTGEKPLSCGLCDYSCTRADMLKKHMRIHTRDHNILQLKGSSSVTNGIQHHEVCKVNKM